MRWEMESPRTPLEGVEVEPRQGILRDRWCTPPVCGAVPPAALAAAIVST